jgi:hypothetical protein
MILLTLQPDVVRASPLRACSICGPARIFLTSKFLVIYFFPTPPIKLKLSSPSDVMKLPWLLQFLSVVLYCRLCLVPGAPFLCLGFKV